MYQIIYVKQAERSLRKLPKNILRRIQDKLALIAKDPYSRHTNVTKLKDREEYRLKVGDWRVIYEIHDGELIILVVKIAPRGSAYE
ncbi:MAG: type II toxin-antitoxin system RelE/ParE family toxin [Chloroflexota bacterium]